MDWNIKPTTLGFGVSTLLTIDDRVTRLSESVGLNWIKLNCNSLSPLDHRLLDWCHWWLGYNCRSPSTLVAQIVQSSTSTSNFPHDWTDNCRTKFPLHLVPWSPCSSQIFWNWWWSTQYQSWIFLCVSCLPTTLTEVKAPICRNSQVKDVSSLSPL